MPPHRTLPALFNPNMGILPHLPCIHAYDTPFSPGYHLMHYGFPPLTCIPPGPEARHYALCSLSHPALQGADWLRCFYPNEEQDPQSLADPFSDAARAPLCPPGRLISAQYIGNTWPPVLDRIRIIDPCLDHLLIYLRRAPLILLQLEFYFLAISSIAFTSPARLIIFLCS